METFTGKLKTTNLLAENFELNDIFGFFSKGNKYSIKKSKGINGIIEKKDFKGRYVLKLSDVYLNSVFELVLER